MQHKQTGTGRTRAPALCLLALVATTLEAQSPELPANPFQADPAAAPAGERVFNSACVACHGGGAAGDRGPPLNTGRFEHGGEDYELFSTIRDGIPGTQMPSFKALPARNIWLVVSYLRSLSGAVAPTSQTAVAATEPTESSLRGATLFFGKGGCSGCHEINGRGSALAADLSAAGLGRLESIREAVLHRRPTRRTDVHGRYVEAVLANNSKISGLVRNEDSFTIHLMQMDGRLRMLDRSSLRSLKTLPTTLAPADVEQRLSAPEIDDLAAFLWQQKARDVTGSIAPSSAAGLSAERLVRSSAEPHNWLTYWGDYKGQHFSELTQITTRNVGTLQARWAARLPGSSALHATPIVIDGVMYVSGSPGEVYSLDARSGLQLWKFTRKQDVTNPYQINAANRGVAVLDGRVFVGTMDDLVIAIDAQTGRELWERRIADTLEGYTLSGAPLALPGKLIVGMAGGEYGLRGFLDAYDPATGARLWRFNTVPGPGEPGNETWSGDSWTRGGGGTWLTGSYDADLNLLYWTVGNPAPSFNAHVRGGDNLYTDSVIALDPQTGVLRWHYQFTPNDSHDWDAAEDLVLTDRVVSGRRRKVLLHADRNGFFYVLDRENGAFLTAWPFVRQTWNDGFDAAGRPRTRPESVASAQAPMVFPAVGGTNFQAPSFDARSGRFFLAFQDSAMAVASGGAEWESGRAYMGGHRVLPTAPVAGAEQGIMALDVDSSRVLWKFPLTRYSSAAGVLGTRGGILFAASAEGNFLALDMKHGRPLWHFRTGGLIAASPFSYAVDGEQYVAIAAGNVIYSFALPR
jgi:alcohol dehydrogenase (cytochrome c)